MAATVTIREVTGGTTGTEAASGITSRFCLADNAVPGTTYPIIKPTGTNVTYSYKKSFVLFADTAPTTAINNVKWYVPGGGFWDVAHQVYVSTATAYSQSTGTQSVSGALMTPSGDLASGFVSASMLTVGGSGSAATGRCSNILQLQLHITSGASPGTQAAKTLTWQYDET